MESIEIKSKSRYVGSDIKNVEKKEMTPTLGLSFGRFFFQKRSLLQSDLDLKNNLNI